MDPVIQVKQYIHTHDLIRPGDHVIVGLSGGADSVCLLHLLAGLREEFSFTLEAVHVHHGIRGAEADRDAAFAEDLSHQLEVPFTLVREDVPALAKEQKLSLEEAGRTIRYEIFRRLRGDRENVRIAVAHHMDDQAETVLLQLSRGAGIRGIAAMAPAAGSVIRPLLCLRRSQIEGWLTSRGEVWCEDSTNREEDFARNRIRHQVLPVLADTVNTKAVEHLAEAARQAGELDAWVEELAQEWLHAHLANDPSPKDRIRTLTAAEAAALPSPLRGRILHILLAEAAGSSKDLGARHIAALTGLVKEDRGASLDLPGGVKAIRQGSCLRIGPAALLEGEEEYLLLPAERAAGTTLSVPGECQVGELLLTLETFPRGEGKIPQKEYTKWFDYDKIKGAVCIRTRRTEDRLAMAGVGHKSLRRYMIDSHIPENVRDRVPILADDEGPLWVIGGRISADHLVTAETRKILAVTVSKGGIGNE